MSTKLLQRRPDTRHELTDARRGDPVMRPTPELLARSLAVVVIVVGVVLAWLTMTSRPDVAPATSAAERFSAARAMTDLQQVAASPHPIGSAAHTTVVRYLTGQLRHLGLKPQVQDDTGVLYDVDLNPSQVSAAHLQNIVARLPGTDSTGTVMLYGHYGSVPTSNNAADGGAGVAAVLETVRALRAGPLLRNDVLVVLADGDETPALGPHLFRSHPWAHDVSIGVTLEGLSPDGAPALVYVGQGAPKADAHAYTSPANGTWLRQALNVMPHRFTALALNDLQIASPELSISTKDAGAGGFGSLLLGGGAAYHTVRDIPGTVDAGALQAYGDNTLALARHFGAANLKQPGTGPEIVAFTVLPDRVVSYTTGWANGLAVVLGGLFVSLVIVGLRRRLLHGWGIGLGLVITVLAVVAAVTTDALAWLGVAAVNPAYRAPMGRGYYGATWKLLFLTCLTLAVISGLHAVTRRFIRPARHDISVATGALVVPVLLAGLTTVGLPAASYVFTWPSLAAVLVLGWRVLSPSSSEGAWARLVGGGAVTLVTAVVVTVPVYLVYSAFAAPASARQGPLFPVIALAFVAILAAVLLPHLSFIGGARRWTVPVAFLSVGAMFLAVELATTRFSPDTPQPDQIQYTLNADTGQATWLSAANQPDDWTKQFFAHGYTQHNQAFSPGYYFDEKLPVITAPAPAVDLAAPRVKVLNDRGSGTRTVGFRLSSPRGATYAHLDLRLPGDLTAATVNGKPVNVADIPAEGRDRFTLLYFGLPPRGVAVTLTVRASGPMTGMVTDYSNGLPTIPGFTVTDRPVKYMPAPFDFRDPTAVTTHVTL
jgi:hypothetical protein